MPENQSPDTQRRQQASRIARWAFLGFLLIVTGAFLWVVLRPLMAPIVLATLVAVIFYPIHDWVEKRLKVGKMVSATISMVLLSLFIVVPGVSFLAILFAQLRRIFKEALGFELTDFQGTEFYEKVEGYLFWIERTIFEYSGRNVDIRDWGVTAVKQIGSAAYQHVPDLLSYAGSFVLAYIVLSIVLFFLFAEGRTIVDLIVELSPMSDRYDRQILSRLSTTINAVFIGALLTSLTQGGIGMLGFLIVGIDNALAWGAIMTVSSLIPVFGTALVWGPATVYLWAEGQTGSAITLIVFGAAIAASDNFIRPLFMRGRAGISPLLIFLSLFGGVQSAGPMGLIYGPLLAATVVEVVRIYRSDFMIPDLESPRGWEPPAETGRRRRRRRFRRGKGRETPGTPAQGGSASEPKPDKTSGEGL